MSDKLKVGDRAADFTYDTAWEYGETFYGTTGKRPVVLVFLRYLGCPVCQMEMAQLKKEVGLFKAKGANVFVALQSSPETVAAVTSQEDWPFTIICDPSEAIFQLYRVAPGGLFKHLHPAGLMAAAKATAKGFRHGKFEGRETQLPAVFVVDSDKTIRWVYYGKTLNDVPALSSIAEQID
ncbi:MAG: peroxiredoxin-like family protein [Myxococcota bacterium]|nr:peroxiredoxin-like family protein [Myxococcota bacterium]